jgi:hypothetical protein
MVSRLKMWKQQGSYKSFNTGEPMLLVNRDGATILEPLTIKRKPTMKTETRKILDKASHSKPIKFGQKLTAPFKIEIFNSKNTSYEIEGGTHEGDATLLAKSNSVAFKAILHDSKGEWIEYVKGVVSSWSVSEDKPEHGKVYALTGGTGTKAISNGNTWAESEVKDGTINEAKTFCPACVEVTLRVPEVRNALSRYCHEYICSDCGTREALEGFFWSGRAKVLGFTK